VRLIRDPLSTWDGSCLWYVWPRIDLRPVLLPVFFRGGRPPENSPLLFEHLDTLLAAFDEKNNLQAKAVAVAEKENVTNQLEIAPPK